MKHSVSKEYTRKASLVKTFGKKLKLTAKIVNTVLRFSSDRLQLV